MNLLTNGPEQEALLAGVKAGNEQAETAFVDAIGELARIYAYRSGLSNEDAEDLGQECVVVVLNRLGQFRNTNFGGWLQRIMLNLIRDFARKRKRQIQTVPLLECDGEIPIGESSHNGVLPEEVHAALDAALNRLAATERVLIGAQIGNHRVPHALIACELGISITRARVGYHRALKKLKDILKADPRMQSWIAR